MFWQSLWHGCKLFGNWQVTLAALLFFGFEIVYLEAIHWATGQPETQDAASAGCLTQLIGVLLQVVALGLLLLLLLPLLLGLQAAVSWSAVMPYTTLAARAGILAMLAISLLSFVPGFRQLLSSSPGVEVLIGGGILFRLLSHPYLEHQLGRKIPPSSLYPGVLECLGYLVLAFVLGRLLMLATVKLRGGSGVRATRFARVWGPSLDCLIGIFVLAMYAQYTALALHSV